MRIRFIDKRKYFALFSSFCLVGQVFSLNFQAPWQNIKPNKDTEIYVYEDFSKKINWHIRSNTIGIEVGFIERYPIFLRPRTTYDKVRALHDSIDKKYIKASSKFFFRTTFKPEKFSSEVQVDFTRPGRDTITLVKNLKKKRINGRAVSIAIWVFGYQKKHTLWGLFRDQMGRKQEYKISNLDFKGWGRIEKRVPYYLMKRNPRNSNHFDFDFYGLKVKSSHSETRGLFIFQFCRVMVLVDHQANQQMGYQIKDNWK